eukprot:scaffold14825_cov123-Isochrysis_galbana.AAC.6
MEHGHIRAFTEIIYGRMHSAPFFTLRCALLAFTGRAGEGQLHGWRGDFNSGSGPREHLLAVRTAQLRQHLACRVTRWQPRTRGEQQPQNPGRSPRGLTRQAEHALQLAQFRPQPLIHSRPLRPVGRVQVEAGSRTGGQGRELAHLQRHVDGAGRQIAAQGEAHVQGQDTGRGHRRSAGQCCPLAVGRPGITPRISAGVCGRAGRWNHVQVQLGSPDVSAALRPLCPSCVPHVGRPDGGDDRIESLFRLSAVWPATQALDDGDKLAGRAPRVLPDNAALGQLAQLRDQPEWLLPQKSGPQRGWLTERLGGELEQRMVVAQNDGSLGQIARHKRRGCPENRPCRRRRHRGERHRAKRPCQKEMVKENARRPARAQCRARRLPPRRPKRMT